MTKINEDKQRSTKHYTVKQRATQSTLITGVNSGLPEG